MFIFHTANLLRHFLNQFTDNKATIGFVPTMGALHPGHISLVETSKKNTVLTVSSIFVNPTQFNDSKDFQNYPVTIAKDIKQLEQTGCDVLFLPSVNEVYTTGMLQLPQYELGYLETVLEGKYRPGHFQGVCQVVDRLLTVIKPDYLFMGQKDYQQCMVIQQLLKLIKKEQQIKLNICPTLREPDGLAMSSRNLRLSAQERIKASSIFQTLNHMKEQLRPGSLLEIKKQAAEELERKGFAVDYTEIADAATLELIDEWNGQTKLVALIAAFNGSVRLIDNMILTD